MSDRAKRFQWDEGDVEITGDIRNRQEESAMPQADDQMLLSMRDAVLPILNSLEAIRKIDDPTQQREAATALLKNIPHLETVILQNRSLANKLMPELVDAFAAGLKTPTQNK